MRKKVTALLLPAIMVFVFVLSSISRADADIHVNLTSYQVRFDDLPEYQRNELLALLAEVGATLVSDYVTVDARVSMTEETYNKIMSCEYEDCCRQLLDRNSRFFGWIDGCSNFFSHDWQSESISNFRVECDPNCGSWWFTGQCTTRWSIRRVCQRTFCGVTETTHYFSCE